MGSAIASFGEWPGGVARLGVVVCVTVAAAVSVGAFSDALSGSDSSADRNSALDYVSRSVPTPEAVVSAKVVEDARLWMPENATYRIVAAPDLRGPRVWAAPDFLAGFLLPRRQTESTDTPWVFCFSCDIRHELGDDFEVLSDDGRGVIFGRSGQ